MTVLDDIFAHKRAELELRKQKRSLAEVKAAAADTAQPGDFIAALRSGRHSTPALIAEVKRFSPSRGALAPDLDPLSLAQIYRDHGAAAISVLTDERYFGGHLETLEQMAHLPGRPPLLRKDFIFDAYQIFETRAAGADAVLLITAILDPGELQELHDLATELGLAALVEVHTAGELESALKCTPRLMGINNRDLHDFHVELDTTLNLRLGVPPGVCLVAESGIHSEADIERLAAANIDAILVGEALVTAPDIAARVRSFSGRERNRAH
jgi:indole-3-glycerol phosphate synthase